MISPASLAGALAAAGTSIAIAGALVWKRQRSIFWFACALVSVSVGYLMATGATEDIARFLWPVAFDPVKRRELETLTATNFDTILGAFLIASPFLAVAVWTAWRQRAVPLVPSILLMALLIALHMTPHSARLARLVFSESVLEAPMRQMHSREAAGK